MGDDDDFSALRNRVLHGRVGPAIDAQCGTGTYQYLERTLSDSDTTYIITSVYLVAFVLLILWKEDQKLAEKILCAILAAAALWAMWFFFMGGARFA